MICSGGVGGSTGVGWVLLRQPERGQCAYEIYAIIISKYMVQLLAVWVPASNFSMQIAIHNSLDACKEGSGVQLVPLRCLCIVKEGGSHFLSGEGCMSYFNKTCCGFVSRGIVLQLLGGMSLQLHWSAIYNNCR